MSKRDNLHELIQSLTKAEKRAFKLSTQAQKGEKQYLKLFEILENQKEYDEKRLKTLIKDGSFIKNLSRNKNYLYQLIIKSIVNSETDDLDILFHDLMKQAILLFNKGLFEQSVQLTNSIREKTKLVERECFEQLIDLLAFEKKNFIKKSIELDDIKRRELSEKIETYVKAISEYEDIYSKYDKATESVKKKTFWHITQEEKNLIKKTLNDPAFKRPEDKLSFRSKIVLYDFGLLNLIINEDKPALLIEKFATNYLKIIEEKREIFVTYKPFHYLRILNNISVTLMQNKLWNGLKECLKHFNYLSASVHKFHSKNVIEPLLLIKVFENKLHLYFVMQRFEDAAKYIAKNEDFVLQKYNHTDKNLQTNILISIIQVYSYLGQYRKAMKINNLIEHTNAKIDFSKILLLKVLKHIYCLELNEKVMFDSVYRSTSRSLEKTEEKFLTYTTFLNYLNQIHKCVENQKEKNKIYMKLLSELKHLKTLPEEKDCFELFDLELWVESKLQNTTMTAILKKNQLPMSTI